MECPGGIGTHRPETPGRVGGTTSVYTVLEAGSR